MKKLLAFIFIMCISVALFAEITNKNVVGKWNYTVVTDQGDMTGALKFAEKEGKLTGEVHTLEGNVFTLSKVEIKEGNVLYFELQPDYDVLKVSVTVEGKKFKGSVSSAEGEFQLTGEKVE